MKLIISLLFILRAVMAQPVIDSISNSGNLTGVNANATFSWSNTTSTNPNRAIFVIVTEADLTVQGITVGGVALAPVTSCSEPQYVRHAGSIWKLSQPASGTAPIVVTLGGVTQFHMTARNASAIAYNLSSVDPIPVDKVLCHASLADSRVSVQSEVLALANTLPNEVILLGMMVPNTNDAARIFNWPGIEDQLFVANSGDVSIYSHLGDSGAAGTYNYRWDWQNFEPVVSVAISVKPYINSNSPPPSTSNGITWFQGNLIDRPATCTAIGFSIYLAPDVHTLFWCLGPGGQWQPPAPAVPLPGGDDWAMAFHDAGHSGRSSDVVTPPLTPIWQWVNNIPYDVTKFTLPNYNLPIAFGGKACFQGGLNANRFICLHQDRSFAFESDNSGYTESGAVFQFLNYPVMAAGRIVFGSTDFTTTVSAVDGSGFLNIYNTNGGWPFGGSTAINGMVVQQFIETDSGLEDVVVYQSPSSLVKTCAWQQTVPRYDMSFKVPATDGKAIYANVDGNITAFNPATCVATWSSSTIPGVSPAVSAGVVYYHNGTAMIAARAGSVLWAHKMPPVYSPIVSGGVLYGGASDGTFWALQTSDGSALWSFRAQSAFTPLQIPALSGSLIYVPSTDGRIYTLDAITGRQVDLYAGSAAWGPIIISHGILYSSDARGTMYAFRPSYAR